jgi:ABC-type amino acid transport substrate-binding protein
MGPHLRPAKNILGHTAFAIALLTTAASAQDLCSVYTVKPGDTLSGIAKAAGVSNGYQGVYASNRDVLSNPNIVEIGQKLTIPCADGSLPGTTEAAAEVVAEPPVEVVIEAPAEPVVEATTEAAVAESATPVDLPMLRFLTGGDYAPFVDEELPEGGMMVEIIKAAMARGDAEQDIKFTVVNDWGSHLTELLPSGAFDAGFPWFLPDCSKIDLFSDATKSRCTDFDASDPLFEIAVGFYAKPGNPASSATTYEDLKGKRLCRPEGWFTFDLEAAGLVEPAVTMLVPPTQVECWRALEADEVDVVTFDALPAEADIATLQISDNVKEITPLAGIVTSHVFIPKNNPNGDAYLDILNEGLADMRADGTWFGIVSTRMREHEELNASDN